jgi:hypothetical protein
VAIDAKLGDDYEPNDQGVKVADLPVINAYRSPLDRSPADKPPLRDQTFADSPLEQRGFEPPVPCGEVAGP